MKILFILLFTNTLWAAQNNQFQRSDKGEPITGNERKKATEEFISILKQTQYFNFASTRVHGWPEDDDSKTFWWSSMWTGVTVSKLDGKVTYTHQNNGSDNIGIHTSPYLEGACYAYQLTHDEVYAHLARRLIRGFSAWILSSSRSTEEVPQILSRSFYPESFSSKNNGMNLTVDYSASRPGIHSEASDYVHIPNNPTFGDVWVKNKRSIDDIGQMIRAIAHTQACRNLFNNEARADLDQMNALYYSWAKSVDTANFIIPTFDLNARIFLPVNSIGDYNVYKILGFDPNCSGKLAIRLLHSNNPSELTCGNGISNLEIILRGQIKNDALEILRSHHIAAIAMAELNSLGELANKLRSGLAKRMDNDFFIAKNPERFPQLDIQDIAAFYIHANNVGVPMTSEEIRFLYQRLHMAFTELTSPSHFNTFHLFESTVPNGNYSYDAPNSGLYFYSFAPMLGTCLNSFTRQINDRPIIDCEQVQKALKEK